MLLARRFTLALLLLAALLALSPAQAAAQQLVIVLIPDLSLTDLSRHYHLNQLSSGSCIGLMNSSGAAKNLASSYLALSTGNKNSSAAQEVTALQSDETYHCLSAQSFSQRMLGLPSAQSAVWLPFYHSLIIPKPGTPQPTFLGDILLENNCPFLFIGNQDRPGVLSRPGALFAATKTGLIKEGWVDRRTYQESSYSPTVFTTNYAFYLEQSAAFLQRGKGLLALELGDLSRLDSIKKSLSPTDYEFYRGKILDEIDVFIGAVRQVCQKYNCPLLMVTPFPEAKDRENGNTLVPVLLYRPGQEPGVLSSGSTKRRGLISNLDIAPGVVSILGLPSEPGFYGYPLQAQASVAALPYLESFNSSTLANHLQRPVLLKAYVLLQIILVISALLFLFLRRKTYFLVSPFVLALCNGPLFFLILPLLPTESLWGRALLLAGLMAFSAAAYFNKNLLLKRLLLVNLLTMTVLIIDLLGNGFLIKSSLLGYDPISGARYYGLGNEYMGVLLGSTVTAISWLQEIIAARYPFLQRRFTLLLPIFLGFITWLVASPQWGANVGGGITFFCTSLLFILLSRGWKIRWQTTLTLGALTLGALVLLFCFDLSRPLEAQSHMGLTARLIQSGGAMALADIVYRKAAMNLKLLEYSYWSRVFITFLLAVAFFFYRPPGLLKRILGVYSHLRTGFIAGISGTFIALAVNDSGIVAAATSMIFIAPALFYLIQANLPEHQGYWKGGKSDT